MRKKDLVTVARAESKVRDKWEVVQKRGRSQSSLKRGGWGLSQGSQNELMDKGQGGKGQSPVRPAPREQSFEKKKIDGLKARR